MLHIIDLTKKNLFPKLVNLTIRIVKSLIMMTKWAITVIESIVLPKRRFLNQVKFL